jgi:hypothetical protein
MNRKSNFWKIACLSCQATGQLLTDKHDRFICRPCLITEGFKEVENEIFAYDDTDEAEQDEVAGDL